MENAPAKTSLPNLVPLSRVRGLQCPECALPMTPFHCQGRLVQKCPLCEGIWFARGSFGVFRDTLRDFDLSKIRFTAGVAAEQPEEILSCPKCNDVLTGFRYAYNSRVHLQRCDHCGGTWMPFSELLNVLDLAKLSQEIAPHVSAVAKELNQIQSRLDSERRFTEAMRDLEKPVYSPGMHALSSLLIFIPLYDNVERTVIPYATASLIAADSLIYLLGTAAQLSPEITSLFGLAPGQVPSFPSLLGHAFFHLSALPLIVNMFFLWMFGDNVEERLGVKLYVTLFLVAGMAAAMTQAWGAAAAPVLGAAGAISGVLGMYFVLFPRATVTTLLGGHLVDLPSYTCFALWFFLQPLLGYFFPEADIGWRAHAAAFLAGAAMAWALARSGSVE